MATAEWAACTIQADKESYALYGRMKSQRRRIRNRKAAQDKQLLKCFKELRRVRKIQRNLPLSELKPPVQKGWKRYFVLRPDLANTKDAAFFNELLEKINTVEYSLRKDFKRKRRKHGKTVYVDKVQRVREFYGYETVFRDMNEKESVYFKQEIYFIDHSTKARIKYVFTEPWRYVLRVRPNMITHMRTIDPDLKSREKELDNYFERNNLHPRLTKLKSRRSYSKGWWTATYPSRQKTKHELRMEVKTFNKNTNE